MEEKSGTQYGGEDSAATLRKGQWLLVSWFKALRFCTSEAGYPNSPSVSEQAHTPASGYQVAAKDRHACTRRGQFGGWLCVF